MKPVLVIWHDAHAGTGTWEFIDDMNDQEPYVVRSVGFLLESKFGKKRAHISITQSISQEGCVDSVLHIPVKMVQKIINLDEVEIENTDAHSPNPPQILGPMHPSRD